MNYYRRYVGDYLKKTARLSITEHGAYNIMLDYYYSEEKPLPLDLEEIFTMCRAMKPADRAAIVKILDRYFEKRADGYHNIRADEEIAKASPAIEAARVNGKKGGRRSNPPDNRLDNPPGYIMNEPNDEPTGLASGKNSGLPTGLASGQHPPTSNLQPLTTNPLTPNPQPPPPMPVDGIEERPRASRLPPSWTLPAGWETWAMKEKNLTGKQALDLADKFRDYWIAKPGSDGTKLDWEATWRNWVRGERGPPGSNGSRAQTIAERNDLAAQEWLARAREAR